ncbi:hypothetical protein TNCV_4392881 [Trichonephila clavipes]|nr:hypothetical protein TNCV_4392881 [Trichonephila clavipes]
MEPVVPYILEEKISKNIPAKYRPKKLIVRVQYFVRGGFVGHRSRVSSKHPSSLIFRSTVFDSSGVKKGLRCSCKIHVWVSGPPKISTAAGSGYVTLIDGDR